MEGILLISNMLYMITMKKQVSVVASSTLALLFSFLLAAPVHAETITSSFESPAYTAGDINGQDGWQKTGGFDVAVTTNTYGITSFGGQSLRLSDAVTSGSFGDQTFSKALVNEAGETDALNGGMSGGTRQSHFEAQFDLASTMTTQQSGMHFSVSPDRGDGARMSYLRFEDSAAGIAVFFDDVQGMLPAGPDCGANPCANFVETQIATLTRAPHTIKFVMDFVEGPSNDVVKIYIDGALIHTGTSWEDYFRFDPESNPTLVSNSRTVDSLLFRESGTATVANQGNGFLIDNLSLLSGPVLVGPPTTEKQCKKDGWKIFNNPSFKNQGACEKFVEKNKDKKEHKKEQHSEREHNRDHD